MRPLGIVPLLLVLAATLGGGAAARAEETIAVLGDSLTAGFGVAPDEAYPALLQERVRREGYDYRVVNAGVSGDTTAGGLRRVDWVLRSRPAIVIVALGANDGLRGLSVAAMRANLEQIVERFRAAGAQVLLAGMRVPPNYGEAYGREFAAAFPAVARKTGAAADAVPPRRRGGRPAPQPGRRHPSHRQGPGDHRRARVAVPQAAASEVTEKHGSGRVLADLTPALALLLAPLREWLARPWPRRLFIALTVSSVLAHAAGVFWEDGRWNVHPDVDHFPHRLWSWSDNPLSNTATDLSGRLAASLTRRPTSGTAPDLVTAALEIAPEPPRHVAPGERIAFELSAANTGPALWLSRARHGHIMVAWRWASAGAPASPPDLILLNHDVPPHRAYALPFRVRAPHDPGTYMLEVGLVALTQGNTRWVAATPGAPLRFVVRVTADGRSGIAALLGAEPRAAHEAAEPPPRARVAVNGVRFAPGTSLIVSVDVANPTGSPPRDLAVGVLLPDRRTAIFVRPGGTPTAPTVLADHRSIVRLLEMPRASRCGHRPSSERRSRGMPSRGPTRSSPSSRARARSTSRDLTPAMSSPWTS